MVCHSSSEQRGLWCLTWRLGRRPHHSFLPFLPQEAWAVHFYDPRGHLRTALVP